jgi:hypothetical protein
MNFIYRLASVLCMGLLLLRVCLCVDAPFSFQKLLENEKLLLVLADRDKHSIYLERLSAMDAAIQRGRAVKTLNRDKVGDDVLFAYDEAKRMLAVCASAKVSPNISCRISKVAVLMRHLSC